MPIADIVEGNHEQITHGTVLLEIYITIFLNRYIFRNKGRWSRDPKYIKGGMEKKFG